MTAQISDALNVTANSQTGGSMDSPLKQFQQLVADMLESKAKEKGYSDGDTSIYRNPLMSFIESNFSGHALGEIAYKAVRYNQKKDPNDLVKIAAWAALKWMEDGHFEVPEVS